MAVASGRSAADGLASMYSRFGSELGNQIFVYHKIDTRQTVYSLERSMQNKSALKQLTFVGKKSVPARLRKDLWMPLCVLAFPNPLQGLSAYQKLLEFKHRHEVAWPLEALQDPRKPAGSLLPKKEKSRQLQDQKANSIADMAHVLAMQKRAPSDAELQHARYMVYGEGVRRRPKGAPPSKHAPGHKHTSEVLEFRGKLDGVSIWWTDPLDAEHADTWPPEVMHGRLAVNRYTAIWPPPQEILLGSSASLSPPAGSAPSDSPTQPSDKSGEGSRWARWFGDKRTNQVGTPEVATARA